VVDRPDEPARARGGGSPVTGGDWAVPGSAAEQPAPADAVPTPPGAGRVVDGGDRGGVPAGGDSAPDVSLRPMTVADVLDGGFAVVKARPRRIFGLAAALIVPTHLGLVALQQSLLGDANVDVFEFLGDPTVANEETSGADLANQYLYLGVNAVVTGLVLVFLAAAIAHLVGQWVMGRDAPAGEMMGVAARRWWPLVGSFFVVKVAELGGLLGCYVGVIFVMPLFVAVAPVVGVEGGGPWEVVRRSARLVKARYFPVMGVALLMGLVATLLSTALSTLPQALSWWLGGDAAWLLVGLGTIASTIVVMPFVAAATVLLYLDLRVRTEGLDLEMAAADLLDRAS
jgi:hypothetical protein